MRLVLAAALLLTLSDIVAAADLRVEGASPSAVVQTLYMRFAAEAVLDRPGPNAELIDQPKPVLSMYFDDGLTALWLRDRACAARTHEVCRLDFAPVWDSQDPGGATVAINPDREADAVLAVVTYGSGVQKVLRYKMVHTTAGWRIHDIVFEGDRQSLRQILSQDLK